MAKPFRRFLPPIRKRASWRVPARPPELSNAVLGYGEIYGLFLKHGLKGGKIKGHLLEVGFGAGKFLSFLNASPFFAVNPQFEAIGVEAKRYRYTKPRVARRAYFRPVEKMAPQYNGAFDFVIAKGVTSSLDEEARRSFLDGVSKVTAVGGKVFLEASDEKKLFSDEMILRRGFDIIDRYDGPQKHILVLEKVR